MSRERLLFRKVRFLISCGLLYGLTLGIGWYVNVQPVATPVAHAAPISNNAKPKKPGVIVISGRPVRIVIPDSQIDKPIDPGYYNADGTWTLSVDRAQFAMISSPANNIAGNTFIYGHGTWAVFESLADVTPVPGATALVYTDNNHIFEYSFQNRRDLTPNDTSVLDYSATPILTVQTCSGSFSQWRSMFQFGLTRVVQ